MLSTHFIALKGSRNLKPRFIGPSKVLKHIGPQAYKLDLPLSLAKLHDVFDVSLLHHYYHSGDG